MSARGLWLLFAGLVLAQWGVPVALVQRAQATLEQGTPYRFRTAPVDPADPFRGRYVALDFEAAQIAVPAGLRFEPDARLWAPIFVGEDGYARLGVPQAQPPEGDRVAVRVLWHDEQNGLRIALPFDRYYMDEQLAPEAERLYRDSNPALPESDEDPRRAAYVSVRVRKGYALIEELYIDGVPVRERLRQAGPSPQPSPR